MASNAKENQEKAAEFKESDIQEAKIERASEANYANKLITTLFEKQKIDAVFEKNKTLNILVVCAGNFPSFIPFTNALLQKCPHLTSVEFSLVDSHHKPMKLFANHLFPNEKKELPQDVETSVTINAMNLGHYMKQNSDKKFDIVFFEHPYVATAHQLLDAGLATSSMVISFIPLLVDILNPHAIIMASCTSEFESSQMKKLLDYSFDRQSMSHSVPRPDESKPKYFSEGVAVIYQQKLLQLSPTHDPLRKSKQIRQDQRFLSLLAFTSLFLTIFSLTYDFKYFESAISLLTFSHQLKMHHPGQGIKRKLGLFMLNLGAIAAFTAARSTINEYAQTTTPHRFKS